MEKLSDLISFNQSTEELLSNGGDDRLTLDKLSRLNKYLSSTVPGVGDDVIRRGSCTCSTIIEEDFLLSKKLLQILVEKNDINYFDKQCQEIIDRLKGIVLSKNDIGDIIIFPSGSDAEFLPVIVALVRSANLYKKLCKSLSLAEAESKVYNIVTAAGEVGSGTANACGGQHFSNVSPRWGTSGKQTTGSHIEGLESTSVEVKQYVPRNSKGEVSFNEQDIVEYVNSKLTLIPHSVAIIHMVCGSKTGLMYPSTQTLDGLQQQWGERVIIVSDNCQLRCPLSMIQHFTSKGYITLLTGSKFFTGPPFSGAVVLPASMVEELESHLSLSFEQGFVSKVPVGLGGYISQHEVPKRMSNLRRFLRESPAGDWVNLGLHLRWQCGLRTMEKYSSHSEEKMTVFARDWTLGVVKLVESIGSPHLEVLSSEMNIVSVSIRDETGVRLSVEDLKEFHRRMLQSDGKGGVSVMLGQPVKVASEGLAVVRIALGADMVVCAVDDPRGRDLLRSEDEAVVCRMRFLASNWSTLKKSSKPSVVSISSGPKDISDVNLKKRLQRIDNSLLLVENPLISSFNNVEYRFENMMSRVSTVGQKLSIGKSPSDVMILYDLDALQHSIRSLTEAFANKKGESLHCFAVKSCPLSHILHLVVNHFGLGLETASIAEVQQALRCDCVPEKIVFDSPCKTIEEIKFALSNGIHVNANSYHELEKIKTVLKLLESEGLVSRSNIGLRINPMVGAGDIAALSTATGQSKFGVPLFSEECGGDKGLLEEKIREVFRENRFLNTIMCHVGSQGMSLTAMVSGVKRISDLADLIDQDCSDKEGGSSRIKFIDIGGGLSVNYSDWSTPVGFKHYADLLESTCPSLFRPGRVVVTEFGKTAVIVSRIEDVLPHPSEDKTFTAIGHCGADLLLRTAYCPDKFNHRVKLLDSYWKDISTGSGRIENCKVTIAGPLCFSGDNIVTNISLPQPVPGDICVILDAGANTLSLFSRHCSRLSPPVFIFRSIAVGNEHLFRIEKIREKETISEVLSFWD